MRHDRLHGRAEVRRIHAFELEDQNWFPSIVRSAGMAYLRFAAEKLGAAEAIRPVIERALDGSGEREILDLCSGGGGPVLAVLAAMREAGRKVRVTLSDRFPDPGATRLVESSGIEGLTYEAEPIDALAVPVERTGLRTLFNAFHHLRPDQARDVLASAVHAARPIAVVEILQRKPLALLGILFSPLAAWVLVPFLRPFRWGWLPLTYLVPVIPLLILWDGIVSVCRIYTPQELLDMTREVDPDGRFDWTIEEVPLPPQPIPGLALIGIPKGS